jgi:ABC-2 type transport system ATP-binding protein
MRIDLDSVALGSGVGASVPPLTLSVSDGAPAVITVETAERPMLVSLLLAGRLRPDAGRVTVDGAPDLDELRTRSALVDTPVVAEPTPGLALAGIVAEEFSFAGLPASRSAVRGFLEDHGLADYAREPIRVLPPTARVRLFSELALLRPGVDFLIITSPERHGGEPAEWFDALAAIGERGTAIAIVTDAATSDILLRLGARDATIPIEPPTVEPLDLPVSTASETSSSESAS